MLSRIFELLKKENIVGISTLSSQTIIVFVMLSYFKQILSMPLCSFTSFSLAAIASENKKLNAKTSTEKNKEKCTSLTIS
jgi:hypothetical protein